jgi:hypothetical protein
MCDPSQNPEASSSVNGRFVYLVLSCPSWLFVLVGVKEKKGIQRRSSVACCPVFPGKDGLCLRAAEFPRENVVNPVFCGRSSSCLVVPMSMKYE